MIKYYGLFNLVKVIKQDKTKNGNTVVFFMAASRRTETASDFKLFKIYGNEADFLIRNLTKDNEGNYQSRKMLLEGYVETYQDNEDVDCIAEVEANAIPPEIGVLKMNLTIKAKTTIKVNKDIYVVKHLDFADKARDRSIEIIVNSGLVDVEDGNPIITASKNSSSANSAKQESNQAAKALNDAYENLSKSEEIIIPELDGNIEDNC